jgi:hypothetical protein
MSFNFFKNKNVDHITISKSCTDFLYKVIEAMLETTEYANITISNVLGLKIQSIDAMAVCLYQIIIPYKRLINKKLASKKKVSVNFVIQSLYTFLKNHRNQNVTFYLHDTNIELVVYTPEYYTYTLQANQQDQNHYVQLPSYITKPSLVLEPHEFSQIVMNMAVGGGFTKIITGNQLFKFITNSETGQIEINIELEKSCITTNNTYITKFLKPMCCSITFCSNVCLYVSKNGPIHIRYCYHHEMAQVYVALVPVNR